MANSFGNVLDKYDGIGPGFDFLRIGLASSIVLTHTFLLTGNDSFVRTTPLWYAEFALVPMFFALSGFLIAGSAQRLSLRNFLINRGLRIVPALAVDILVCALLIGPIVSSSHLTDYFSSISFLRYFLNIVGWIHYDLPGVFKNNPTQLVNGALWTVPWEILCYAVMSLLMVTGFIRSGRSVLMMIAAYVCIGFIVEKAPFVLPADTLPTLDLIFVSRGAQLITAFLLGIAAYQFRFKIPYSRTIFATCAIISLIAIFLFNADVITAVAKRPLLVGPLVYMTVFIGVTPMPLPSFLRRGDYSYGVYLYHDPFLQLLIMFFPTLFLIPRFGAVGLYIFGLPIAFAVASISWHFIEMPILQARKKFSFIAKARDIEKSHARVEVSSKAVVAIEPQPAAINHDTSLG